MPPPVASQTTAPKYGLSTTATSCTSHDWAAVFVVARRFVEQARHVGARRAREPALALVVGERAEDDGLVELVEEPEVLRLVDPNDVLGVAALLALCTQVVETDELDARPVVELERGLGVADLDTDAAEQVDVDARPLGTAAPYFASTSTKPLLVSFCHARSRASMRVVWTTVARKPGISIARASSSRTPPAVAPARRVFRVALRLCLLV
jgi:hypothetical protein